MGEGRRKKKKRKEGDKGPPQLRVGLTVLEEGKHHCTTPPHPSSCFSLLTLKSASDPERTPDLLPSLQVT